jgi:hypothetical protein
MNIWNGKHKCDCGWTGMTVSQRKVQLVLPLYFLMFFVVMALDATNVVTFAALANSRWQYPIAAVFLGVYYLLPMLLWKRNVCRQCGIRLEPLQGHEQLKQEKRRAGKDDE